MGTERNRLLVLGALVVVLAVILYRTWTGATGVAPASAPAVASAQTSRPAASSGVTGTPAPQAVPSTRSLPPAGGAGAPAAAPAARVAPAARATGEPTAARGPAAPARQAAVSSGAGGAPEVHLEALGEERPRPVSAERDLFRFKVKAPPPAPRPAATVVAPRPAVVVPPGPPPIPPIPLRFIGIVEAPQQSSRLAALVDAAGRAYHGAEGEIVAGQYRILKIGVESIEIAYLDGRGRQVIRLSGS